MVHIDCVHGIIIDCVSMRLCVHGIIIYCVSMVHIDCVHGIIIDCVHGTYNYIDCVSMV